ncbi:hypothetical protein SPONN_2037 [uncultured Candidatus Thioglobus sp.]|nr:hypothetical protein SPONN_2037 [uncultured Candidatus Thioglobus sp.]
MENIFSTWLDNQVNKKGLKDIKFAIGGNLSEVSVSKAKAETVRLHKMAEAGIITSPPKATDYNLDLKELNSELAR